MRKGGTIGDSKDNRQVVVLFTAFAYVHMTGAWFQRPEITTHWTFEKDYSANRHISNRSILTWENFCQIFCFFLGRKPMKIWWFMQFQSFSHGCSTIFDHRQRTVTCLFQREKKSKQHFTEKLPNAAKLFTHNFSASPSQWHIKRKIQITGTCLTVTPSPSLNQMQ